MSERIRLRPAEDEDEPLLFRVYAESRAIELEATGWSPAEKDAFLRMQYAAQRGSYGQRFPESGYQVIVADGEPVGRLFLHRAPNEIRIVDIGLLAESCNRGIGSTLLTAILEEAAASSRPVRIFVEQYNPARRLYERLGFVPIGETGIYLEYERPAPVATGNGEQS